MLMVIIKLMVCDVYVIYSVRKPVESCKYFKWKSSLRMLTKFYQTAL